MLRVAAILLLGPSRGRTLGEIDAAVPEIGRLSVIRALNALVMQQILVKSSDTPPVYRANPDHFLYSELRTIATKTFGGFESLVGHMIDAPVVRYAAIFGSFAAGTPGPTSDIDLLLVVSDPTDPLVIDVLSALGEAARSLGREINPVVYDEAEFAAKRTESFLSHVLEGPLMVLKAE